MRGIPLFFFLALFYCISFAQTNDIIWTFDCSAESWSVFEHSEAFDAKYQLPNQNVNSTHLELKHSAGHVQNWLFGPADVAINADEVKHLHFSLTLSDGGAIPEDGISALFVWTLPGDLNNLFTKSFRIFSGQKNYHIDLSNQNDWVGNVAINRFHFPQGDQTANGYIPETAVYALDWVAVTSEATFSSPAQDTTSACIAGVIELSDQLSVTVNGTAAVINSEMISGNMASLKIEFNPLNEAKQTKEFGPIGNGVIAAEISSLKFGAEYEYALIATNETSSDTAWGSFAIEPITTEAELWSFDCWYDGWKSHNAELEHVYVNKNGALKLSNINDGGFIRNQGFSLNATDLKFMSIGVQVENAPSQSMAGSLSNKTMDGGGFNFTWESTDSIIRVDLTEFSSWDGNVDHVWINLVKNALSDVIIKIDWIAFSNNPHFYPEEQQTACVPVAPVLSSPESVVFGNRVSMKATFLGGFGHANIKLWKAGGDTIRSGQLVSETTGVYFSFYDLELNSDYFWEIDISNDEGIFVTDIQKFTTEETLAEEMPMKYWMTPSPFDLIENVNDHLFDQSSWEEAAELVDVYKIHGAYFNSLGNFDRLNLPKLIFTVNKYRMRLAWETIVQGDRNGAAYANDILLMIEEIADNGGKLEFLTWDGMMFRCFYASHTNTKFRTVEEGLEAVAEAARIVKEKYPNFEIIPLPNLPNWDINDANRQIVPHNAGDWAETTGVPSWDYLCDIYLQKATQKGVKTNFIEIDHPFNYYHRTSRAVSAQRISAMKDYCDKNGMELILIVNSSGYNFPTTELTDAQFKDDCLQYLDDLEEDGITLNYIDVESWYPYPQYLTPDSKENSFTNILRDVGNKFLDKTTGVNNYSNKYSDLRNTRIYPNPTNQHVFMTIPDNIGKVSIKLFDINGTVHQAVLIKDAKDYTFNLNDITNGIYFLQIESDSEVVVHKIIKQ
tara:strand:+ start:12027 stop:14888 length:2862 start_codon:yes stop_codon:yes gene_type:complete